MSRNRIHKERTNSEGTQKLELNKPEQNFSTFPKVVISATRTRRAPKNGIFKHFFPPSNHSLGNPDQAQTL